MTDEKKYLLNKLLDRIDYLTNTVNTKAAFIISFNTFILGTVILKYEYLIDSFNYAKFEAIIPIILIFVIVGIGNSLFWVFKAVKPFMDSGNKPSSYHSLLFFGSVSKMTLEDFCKRIDELEVDSIIEDLQNQTHILSIGLTKKFDYLTKSMFWIFWFIVIPLGLIAIIKIIEWFII